MKCHKKQKWNATKNKNDLAVSLILRIFAVEMARTGFTSAIRVSSIALGLHCPCSEI